MKRIFNIVLALSLVLGISACKSYSYETVEGDPTGARIYTLDNGLKVYTIVNKDKPRIDAQIAVKVGSKNDPRETTGLAHYFEHLMFKGTEQFGTQNYEAEKPMLDQIEALFETYRKTEDKDLRKAIYHQIDSISYEASKISIPNEYDKLMASIGASGTNAYTSTDVTCYVENIPSNQIDIWARIQADRFQNCVLRGFHTELETIYEEFNMYNAEDQTQEFNALNEGMFKNHPYNTDVIGLPSHLKNPSITNVKKYHDEWYVPNNMAVVLSGDFDPDKAVKIIDRYFGAMQPNENLRKMEFEPEEPIAEPIVKEVKGNESPNIILGWRFPGANSEQTPLLNAMTSVLYNGFAGLLDLDVNQQQKTLGMYAFVNDMADYSQLLLVAEPKPGQTLDQVRDIALAEIEKLRNGDFDESMLDATVNNRRLDIIRGMESTGYMARLAVNSFICDIPWENVVKEAEILSTITKEDIVRFANENLADNYVYVKKLQDKRDDDGSKIDKPAITPIFTNRDTSSLFLRTIQQEAAAVAPIEPVFVDFSKDLDKLAAKSGIEVLYKQNVTNELFEVDYIFETGRYADMTLPFACDYINYLGTSTMTPEDVQKYLYSLACNMTVSCTGERTYVTISGLAENMEEVMKFMEEFLADAQPNREALEMLKANTIQERLNAKTDQGSNAGRLRSYATYGPENPSRHILSADRLKALTDEELLDRIHNIFNAEHSILYYGPMKGSDFVALVNDVHRCPETLEKVEGGNPFIEKVTEENTVLIAPFDANQSIVYSISSRGEKFNADTEAIINLYNEYFGGGMNSIVFQEMREARGLAYSAVARYYQPSDTEHNAVFLDFIQTQNDKIIDALAAFDEIINNMPQSQKAFDIAKEGLLANLRTQRTVKASVIWQYLNTRKLGLDYNLTEKVYNALQDMTLEDVVKFQQENVKDRKYTICILGRESDFDMEGLARYGKIKKLTTEEIFGY
ncbi:MAG: insulinase family protein [Bacteroidales bacterium]|nr:insulinase family protein [Bacteroidales bacterium]